MAFRRYGNQDGQGESYFVHADMIGSSASYQRHQGSYVFENDVVGFEVSASGLNATNTLLGLNGPGEITYPPSGQAGLGLETGQVPPDRVWVDADQRTVHFDVTNANGADNLRVLTGTLDNDAPGGWFGGTVPPAPHWIYDGVLPEGANSGPDSTDINDDNDLSCTDAEELGSNIDLGGARNPKNPWDFADVPVPALTAGNPSGVRDGVVKLADALATNYYSGTSNNGAPNLNGVDYDTDLNNNGVEDGAEYDRTSAGLISGPPNGAVAQADALVVKNQVGDNCTAVPN